mgnify:CR=1 FL=1
MSPAFNRPGGEEDTTPKTILGWYKIRSPTPVLEISRTRVWDDNATLACNLSNDEASKRPILPRTLPIRSPFGPSAKGSTCVYVQLRSESKDEAELNQSKEALFETFSRIE